MKTYLVNIKKQGDRVPLQAKGVDVVESPKEPTLETLSKAMKGSKKESLVTITVQNSSQQNVYVGDKNVASEVGYLLRPNEILTIVDYPSEVYLLSSGPCRIKVMETKSDNSKK